MPWRLGIFNKLLLLIHFGAKSNNFLQVCGNNESVKFISDWLQFWHEREFRVIKDSSGSDKCSSQGDYAIESDSENIDEDGLKNVLLVTGPVGVCFIFLLLYYL